MNGMTPVVAGDPGVKLHRYCKLRETPFGNLEIAGFHGFSTVFHIYLSSQELVNITITSAVWLHMYPIIPLSPYQACFPKNNDYTILHHIISEKIIGFISYHESWQISFLLFPYKQCLNEYMYHIHSL